MLFSLEKLFFLFHIVKGGFVVVEIQRSATHCKEFSERASDKCNNGVKNKEKLPSFNNPLSYSH